jgi:5-formyltetrahydrofolate cyclo-ligase
MPKSNAQSNAQAKAELRKAWLRDRRSLSPEDHSTKSQAICQNLQQHPAFQLADFQLADAVVLSYFSIRQEPDLTLLLKQMDSKVQWGFPRIEGEVLRWHGWAWGDPIAQGPFNVPEPLPTAPVITNDRPILMLVPCLGLDRAGFRLGYGGGYYDRLLADPLWQQVVTVGIVFEEFVTERLPVEPWDRALMWCCSDRELRQVK